LGSGQTDVKRGAIADCADLVGVPTWRLDRLRRKGKHALWFYKPAPAAPDEHTCHLHLTEPGSDLWRERQAFRDALRTTRKWPGNSRNSSVSLAALPSA